MPMWASAKVCEVKYAVVIDRINKGFSAYVPDLSGCVAATDTRGEVRELINEAIRLRIDSLREHGDPSPEPRASATTVWGLRVRWSGKRPDLCARPDREYG